MQQTSWKVRFLAERNVRCGLGGHFWVKRCGLDLQYPQDSSGKSRFRSGFLTKKCDNLGGDCYWYLRSGQRVDSRIIDGEQM